MKHYIIDFVYTENGQQFGTEANLSPREVKKLQAYLDKLEAEGEISDPWIREPAAPIQQGYNSVLMEIKNAIAS